MSPMHPLFQLLHSIFNPQNTQRVESGINNIFGRGQPQQHQGLGLAQAPQMRPIQGLLPGSPYQNDGAQALQQQQNLHYSIQDPSLQGGGQITNMLYSPAGQYNPYEDYGIGGTDLHQDPETPSPQNAGNMRLKQILQVYKHLK